MKFYDCRTAPSPRRVRILMAEKNIVIETIQVDLAKGEQLGGGFAAVNPHRTVPVLELDNGVRLLDSMAISLYLDEVFPGPRLTGETPEERAVIAMWQREMEMNGFEAVVECFRNSSRGFQGRALTGPVDYEQIPALAERGRLRVRQFFADLNRRLADSPFVAGERFSVADITALVSVDFARAIKEPVPEDAGALKRWHATLSARPSATA